VKTLTVTLRLAPSGDILASGICEDVDQFRDVPFRSFEESLRYFRKKYHARYRVVLNVPAAVRRNR
jgi:hypothetical protein